MEKYAILSKMLNMILKQTNKMMDGGRNSTRGASLVDIKKVIVNPLLGMSKDD